MNNLRINFETTRTNLHPGSLVISGFSNVYYLNTSFSGAGQHQFNFHTGFAWDGVSNVIVSLHLISPVDRGRNNGQLRFSGNRPGE